VYKSKSEDLNRVASSEQTARTTQQETPCTCQNRPPTAHGLTDGGSDGGCPCGGRNRDGRMPALVQDYNGNMADADPIPEDVRAYLCERFRDVRDEAPQGNYYVFSLRLPSGQVRQLKVHEYLFMYSNGVPEFLREHDVASQLERGNVEIAKPLPPA
jgi:hypothetical protein